MPDGWGFSIFTADYRGFVSLTQGATATQESHIRYNGIDPHQRFDSMDFKGPIEQDYLNRHTISAPLRVRSACKGKERHLELRSEITLVAAKGASGLMTVDSLDGEAENKFWITWQKCTK